MTSDRAIVTLAGLALATFIVWFFWMKKDRAVRAMHAVRGMQDALVVVKGGYTPNVIIARSGEPVRLRFRREETTSCSEVVQFPDFNRSATLPTGEEIAIELLPVQPGIYPFSCPMGMYRGKLIVE